MVINMYKHMAKVVGLIKILQGSVVTQTILGGLTIYLPVASLPTIMKIGWQLTMLWQKLSGLLFAHPVCICLYLP